ncbi:hypothetical protein PCLA_16r0196 [Pseudomonas citronellolis]|nr:hypothetical protein PCLA_16r0196 [Pseudomonas citronellolis]
MLGWQLVAEQFHALLPEFHGHGYPPGDWKGMERKGKRNCSRALATYPHEKSTSGQAKSRP